MRDNAVQINGISPFNEFYSISLALSLTNKRFAKRGNT